MRVPTCPILAPCSPPSRPLRAAFGGGLRPVLTAAARGATANPGRDEENGPLRSNKETALATHTFATSRQHNRLIANPVGPAPAGHPARSSRQRRHNGQDLGRDTPPRHRASTARRNAWRPDPRNPSRPAVCRPRTTGRIHDRSRPNATAATKSLPNGGRPYTTPQVAAAFRSTRWAMLQRWTSDGPS